MTDPDDEVLEMLRDAVKDADDRNARITAFCDDVQNMPGQLGALLRQIAHARNEFNAAEQWGGTTVGEECRLNGVLDEAVSTWVWLRAGERS